jgi:hypothetical protein
MEFWAANGFYLWALTTALVIVALAWLGWNTFGPGAEAESAGAGAVNPQALEELASRVTALAEATPHMQATLGRAMQLCGLVQYTDLTGGQAFALALANARGDGFVLSSSVRGGASMKQLVGWASSASLTKEEQSAVEDARGKTNLA